MRPPTLRHRLEYGGYRIASGLLWSLPEPAALRLGEALGLVAREVLRVRRREVAANLAGAFPHRSPSWRSRLERACYMHLGREGAATLRFLRLGAGALVERARVQGLRELRAALARGRGAVLVAGHLGNWEVGGAVLAGHGIPLDVVVRPQSNPLFERDLAALRRRFGMRVIPKGRARREVPRALARGRVVAFLADQDARRSGIFVEFFGRPASTPRGPALFALRCRAPLFLGVSLSEPGGRARYRVRLLPVEAPLSGDRREDVRRLTEAHVRLLEEAVAAAPAQYFWLHRRWKTRPPLGTEAPGGGAPRG